MACEREQMQKQRDFVCEHSVDGGLVNDCNAKAEKQCVSNIFCPVTKILKLADCHYYSPNLYCG